MARPDSVSTPAYPMLRFDYCLIDELHRLLCIASRVKFARCVAKPLHFFFDDHVTVGCGLIAEPSAVTVRAKP
jgi:hypothetical protein